MNTLDNWPEVSNNMCYCSISSVKPINISLSLSQAMEAHGLSSLTVSREMDWKSRSQFAASYVTRYDSLDVNLRQIIHAICESVSMEEVKTPPLQTICSSNVGPTW